MTVTKKGLLNSYTYFETKSGLVAYTYGNDARYDDEKMVCSIVGYFAATPTDRIQLATGKYFEKLIWEGNAGNRPITEHFRTLPAQIRKQLKGYTVTHPISGESLVVIPKREVGKVYSPRASLLNNPRQEETLKLIKTLQKHGLGIEDLGVYGSLQIGIFNKSPIVDLDLLVFGTKNYQKVLEMTRKQENSRTVESKHRSINEIPNWRIARERRDSVAKLFIDEKTHADIRMVREAGDSVSLDFQNLAFEKDEIFIEGIVTNSEEGLCIPSVLSVKVGTEEYLVGTRTYVYFAAGTVGDKVKVKGRKIKNKNVILITKPKEHYILFHR